MNRLISGTQSYRIPVPYKLSEQGEPGRAKPLIVYLHGYSQNIDQFETYFDACHHLNAYHLYIQAPYPTKVRVEEQADRGYAWYLYGDESTYRQNLELSSEFIQETIDHVLQHINASEICLIGYSMGAYQAGYWTLSRWKHIHKAILINGRLKIELFTDCEESDAYNYNHLQILAIHGAEDTIVRKEPNVESFATAQSMGIQTDIIVTKGGHKLTQEMTKAAAEWLVNLNYQSVK